VPLPDGGLWVAGYGGGLQRRDAEGRVTLTVAPDGPGHITFAVSDTGVGIEPAHQERIFEAFVQADDSFTRTHQGTGLGLTLSRRFSTLLGGTLTLLIFIGEAVRDAFDPRKLPGGGR
jgi:signal transduction histidine kinase